MLRKRLLIALLTICVCLISVLIIGVQTSHPAGANGVIDPTCVSSLPCIEYDNNGTGLGIRGVSLSGNGVNGQTKFNSTNAGNGRAGVQGADNSTSGLFNSGVHGVSPHGTGVIGSGAFGVSGVGGQTGVTGSGTYGVVGNASEFAGVLGSGPTGVAGINTTSATSDALLALGNGGRLIRAHNSHRVDVFTLDDGGNMNLTNSLSVGGNAGIDSIPRSHTSLTIGHGTTLDYGTDSQGNTVGVIGSGPVVGVEGISTGTFPGVAAVGGGGNIYEGFGTSGPVFTVDNSGNVHAHSFTSDLAVSNGQKLGTYAPQVSQPVIEDFGEAELTGGSAYVHLESRFASTMAQDNYLVFITPEGDNRGLYVTQKSANGFAVRESQGGHSILAFSYRIVARPLGNVAPRLPVEIERRVPRPILPRATPSRVR